MKALCQASGPIWNRCRTIAQIKIGNTVVHLFSAGTPGRRAKHSSSQAFIRLSITAPRVAIRAPTKTRIFPSALQ